MPTHKGTFSVNIFKTPVTNPVQISITVGMGVLSLYLSRKDADLLSCFLSVTNTPSPQANYPPVTFSVLPTIIISSTIGTYEVRWLSCDEVDIENITIPFGRHFIIETGLANLLSEEIAANSINPIVHTLQKKASCPVPPKITFNVYTGTDKNFPIHVVIFDTKLTLEFCITEGTAQEITDRLKNRQPRFMAFGDWVGNSWAIYWKTPHEVEFQVSYKNGSNGDLSFDDKSASRLAQNLLFAMTLIPKTTTVNTKQVPSPYAPTENQTPQDFDKEMRKRKDRELGRILGFD